MPGLTLTITVWVVSTAGSFGVAQMVSYELSTKITCDVAAAVVCHVIVATPADVALPCTFDIDNPVCAWPGMAASPMSKTVVAPLNSASDSCERSDMSTPRLSQSLIGHSARSGARGELRKYFPFRGYPARKFRNRMARAEDQLQCTAGRRRQATHLS